MDVQVSIHKVTHLFSFILTYIYLDTCVYFDLIYMYTNNCRYLSCFMFIGQFKSAKAFNWLAMQHARTNVRFLWNFFESGHGKGEHDGAGACIKRVLRQHELAGKYMHFLCAHV